MLTTDFYEILGNTCLGKYFDGVFPADQIPSNIKVDHFIICNVDTSLQIGSHWYVVYRHGFASLECFDSLGITDTKKTFLIENFNYVAVHKIKCNSTAVQSSNSTSCGLFCLFFIYNRLFNKDLTFQELLDHIFCQ